MLSKLSLWSEYVFLGCDVDNSSVLCPSLPPTVVTILKLGWFLPSQPLCIPHPCTGKICTHFTLGQMCRECLAHSPGCHPSPCTPGVTFTEGLLVFANLSVYMHALVPRFLFMTFEIHLISYSSVSFTVTAQGLGEPGLCIPLAWPSLGPRACRIRHIYFSSLTGYIAYFFFSHRHK